ncbi:MAG: endolytic transglycosylase MltG [bacterium]|nr:endolytic transglycosylase MltG [bacterium]
MKKKTLIINIAIVVAVVAAALGAVTAYAYYDRKMNEKPADVWEGLIEIPSGATTTGIANTLEDEGVIADARTFIVYCKLHDYDGKLKAGKYQLNSSMSLKEIAEILVEGKEHLVAITVPPGLRIEAVARAVERSGVFTADEFLAACKNGDPEGRIEPGVNLEGYLFPETYMVAPSTSPEQLIGLMLNNYFGVIDDDAAADIVKAGRDPYQALIIGSIVEREAMVDEERPLVAAVFFNRLERGMRMESCATVIYAMGYVPEELSQQDLKIDSPYNTYINAGLPPGPICSPGRASLEAAIYPADVDYLFFASNADGTHTFTSTYAEHVKARKAVEDRLKREKEK